MPEEQRSPTGEVGRDLTAKIVAAFVRQNQIPASRISEVIATIYQALNQLGQPAEPVVERTPAVPIRRSVGPDFIICLECGTKAKMLRRHLATRHGLSIPEYRDRWNLKPDYPMVAPAYSEHRAAMARQIGLGQRRGAATQSGVTRRRARSGS